MAEEQQILTEVRGTLGVITLNRPRAINSLSHEMIRGIDAALTEFERDSRVKAVLITGAGERGLCAGGDIVTLYHVAESDPGFGEQFFRDEYALNYRIATYPKPYIALMDGVVLGGGVGVSGHGSHRIVTERSRVGMPETIIGFSPDVGGLKLLSQAPRQLGTMLAMTGMHMSGADALVTGMADYFVPSKRLEELIHYLESATDAQVVDLVIRRFTAEPPESELAQNAHWINTAFSGNSAVEIYRCVEAEAEAGNEYAVEVLKALKHNSPTGISVALAGVRQAKTATLAQTLNANFAATYQAMKTHDLREGIRAQVIDKDKNPRWQPATLGEVSDESVATFFELPASVEPLGLE